ncbi:hypothetical protein [Desulfobacter sp.]|uniref:hypothetical protein n=1 Tax=Desulfobacter sp. TaxID=2294 RepID=UPI003D0AC091
MLNTIICNSDTGKKINIDHSCNINSVEEHMAIENCLEGIKESYFDDTNKPALNEDGVCLINLNENQIKQYLSELKETIEDMVEMNSLCHLMSSIIGHLSPDQKEIAMEKSLNYDSGLVELFKQLETLI